MNPKILDLFSGAGGAARGYQDAGFEVCGVDLHSQANYCGEEFWEADALDFLHEVTWNGCINEYAAVHASPPCQAHSDLQKQNKRSYPDLIEPTRELLRKTGLPYVIENVEGAPLTDPVMLCGTMFPGLRVIRHRLFESRGFSIVPLAHGSHPLVFTHDKRKAHYGQLDQDTSFVQVTGGGNATIANKRDAMGIDWPMTNLEVNEAIPPAFTRFIGEQLKQSLETAEMPETSEAAA